ncbi:MAG: EamA family transporter [candidate division Zixibacteria bacterium]
MRHVQHGAGQLVAATISWAIGSTYSRYADQPSSKLLGVGMQMITGGTGLLIISFISGEILDLNFSAITLRSWFSLGYLISFGSIAFAAYVWLLSASTPAKASTYAFVNPIIALILGAMLAEETLISWTPGCSILVIVAVVIIKTPTQPKIKRA